MADKKSDKEIELLAEIAEMYMLNDELIRQQNKNLQLLQAKRNELEQLKEG